LRNTPLDLAAQKNNQPNFLQYFGTISVLFLRESISDEFLARSLRRRAG
jgi:hypothetical protein